MTSTTKWVEEFKLIVIAIFPAIDCLLGSRGRFVAICRATTGCLFRIGLELTFRLGLVANAGTLVAMGLGLGFGLEPGAGEGLGLGLGLGLGFEPGVGVELRARLEIRAVVFRFAFEF